jgi:hypothetical protein
MRRCTLCAVAVLLLLGWVTDAAAHVPELRGRLVDLVGRSDAIAVGTVTSSVPVDKRLNTTTVRLDAVFSGALESGATLSFASRPRFAAGRRFVFFLGRNGTALECLQESGTVFPTDSADDAAYRQTVLAIAAALRGAAGERDAALRAALIPALSAPASALRYYAVLDFAALTHHGLSGEERQQLQRLVDDPATDPAIRPVIAGLLHRST